MSPEILYDWKDIETYLKKQHSEVISLLQLFSISGNPHTFPEDIQKEYHTIQPCLQV